MRLVYIFLVMLTAAEAAVCKFPDDERSFLVDFFHLAKGDQWHNSTGWLDTELPVCEWYGVDCEAGEAVTRLHIPRNNLAGDLETAMKSLHPLQCLRYFNVHGNQLSGNFPQSFPEHWKSSMQVLDLGHNPLTAGDIPATFGELSSLRILALEFTDRTGTLPVELCNLQLLESFTLNSNKLEGALPACVGNWTQMLIFYADQNRLLGGKAPLPSSIGEWKNIREFSVSAGNFSGPLPDSIGEWSNLVKIGLNENHFSGVFPSASAWTRLEEIDIRQNQFEGPLPVHNWPNMTHYFAYRNYFNGTVDLQTMQMWTRAKNVAIQRNKLEGVAPLVDGMQDLVYINIDENAFTELPASVSLPNLDRAVLTSNSFSGTFVDMSECRRLRVLDVSYNKLTAFAGLPSSLQTFTASSNAISKFPDLSKMPMLTELVFNKNLLSGQLPPEIPSLSQLEVLDLSHNRFSGSLDTFLGELSPFKTYLAQLPQSLRWLDVSFNALEGELLSYYFGGWYASELALWIPGATSSQYNIFFQLRVFYAANNSFSGRLPHTHSMRQITEVDFTNNKLDGIHETWNELPQLSLLKLRGNPDLRGEDGFPFLPAGFQIDKDSTRFACPVLESSNGATVELDRSFYDSSLCRCNIGYFGHNGKCILCDATRGCKCEGDIVAGCWPVLGDDLITESQRFQEDPNVMLQQPCPNPLLSKAVCNPHQVHWPADQIDPPESWCPEHSRSSRMCLRCKSHYYLQGSDCKKCPSAPWMASSTVLVLLAFFLLVLVLLQGPKTNALLRTAIFHMQLLNIVLQSGVPWETSALGNLSFQVAALQTTSSTLTFSTGSQLHCWVESEVHPDSHLRLYMSLGLLPAFLLFAGLIYRCGERFPRCNSNCWASCTTAGGGLGRLLQVLRREKGTVQREVASGMAAEVAVVMVRQTSEDLVEDAAVGEVGDAVEKVEEKDAMDDNGDGDDGDERDGEDPEDSVRASTTESSWTVRCLHLAISLANLGYTGSFQDALAILGCIDDGEGRRYLASAPSESCEIDGNFAVALITLMVFGLGIPSVFAYIIFREVPSDKLFITLSKMYRPDKGYWELVVLVRRFFLVVFLKCITFSNFWRYFLMMILMLGSLLLQVYNLPYKHPQDNHLETASLTSIVITLMSGMCIFIPAFGQSNAVLLTTIVVIANAALLLSFLLFAVHMHREKLFRGTRFLRQALKR